MNILLVSDAFPPMRTSAAVHMHDLACALAKAGHGVTVLVPASVLSKPCVVSNEKFGKLVRIKTPNTKDIGYFRRTLAELSLPFVMFGKLKRTSIYSMPIDGIVWYSPTIFFGPLISRLKNHFQCKAYLVLRDLFPDWAVDIGVIKKGFPYYFLKHIELGQYRVADRIGVQCPGNIPLIAHDEIIRGKAEVLWTWTGESHSKELPCSIRLGDTSLLGRKVFVYAGNMGVAQGMGVLLNLAGRLQTRSDIGFVFVGRGSGAKRLQDDARTQGLDNVLFYDEIHPDEIPGLYAQCAVGLVALDPRHKVPVHGV